MKCTLLSGGGAEQRWLRCEEQESESLGSPSFYRTCTVTPLYLCLEHSGERERDSVLVGFTVTYHRTSVY